MSTKHKRKLIKSISCDSPMIEIAKNNDGDDSADNSTLSNANSEEKPFLKREEFICSTAHNAHLQEDYLEDKSQLFGRQLPTSVSRNFHGSSKSGLKHVSSERLLRKLFRNESINDTKSLRSVKGGKSAPAEGNLTPVQEEVAPKKRRRGVFRTQDEGTEASDGPQKPPRKTRDSKKSKASQSVPDSPPYIKSIVVQNGNCLQDTDNAKPTFYLHEEIRSPKRTETLVSTRLANDDANGNVGLLKRNSIIRPLRCETAVETPKLYQRRSFTHQNSFSGEGDCYLQEDSECKFQPKSTPTLPVRPERHKLLKRESLIHPIQSPKKDFPLGMGSLFQPQLTNGRFQNPLAWFAGNGTGTWQKPSIWSAFKWRLTEKNNSSLPSKLKDLDSTLPVIPLDTEMIKTPPEDGVRVTWFGHASLLVQFDGCSILTDPVFGERASPFSHFGPKRIRKMPGSVHDLPKIDAVIISHNHYDHLDASTVVLLNARFGQDLHWFVPLGLAQWMRDTNITNVTELTWWQEGSLPKDGNISFVLTPAQHWSRRGLMDENKTLWGSWCILGPRHRFFFTGDSGYCGDAFRQIGDQYGPFDLAAIPIGAYQPRWFLHPQHVSPEEAVKIHFDIKSKKSIGIHWGTFILSDEHYLEPPKILKEAALQEQLAEDDFFVLKHGESKIVGNSS